MSKPLLTAAALLALATLSGCADPQQQASANCYQWNPVEQAIANAVPWAPKQSPNCP